MPSHLETLETKYTVLLDAIPYLLPAAGGTIIAAADAATLFDLTTLIAPAAVVAFDGEIATSSETIRDGAIQQSSMEWSIFVVASSFASAGEGRIGAYQMVDDVIAAVQGKTLSLDPPAKPFYVRSRRYNLTANTVIYQVTFRNQFTRDQVTP